MKNTFGSGNNVLQEEIDKGNADPLWQKVPIYDDFFTLGTTNGAKVLTATSEGDLEIAGNFDLCKPVGICIFFLSFQSPVSKEHMLHVLENFSILGHIILLKITTT